MSNYNESMEWLNYHHLLYFWVVARTGSIAKASAELLLAPPTISAQIGKLEDHFGEKLFSRSGRRLILTETGRVVFRYAEEIFALGRELTDTLRGRPVGRPVRLRVGVADVLPKRIAHRLVEPAFHAGTPVRVICREDRPDRLLMELAVHELDVVLSDAPVGPNVKVHAFNHLLGECGVSFLGTSRFRSAAGRRFPRSLDGTPVLLPTDSTFVRPSLDQWFESQNVRPEVIGEFDDFSLLRVFGETGMGIFAAPSVMERELCREGRLTLIGRTEDVRARFYAISVERKIKNPAVVAICDAAREKMFG